MKILLQKITIRFKIVSSTIYATCLSVISLLPKADFPKAPLFPGADKLVHAVMYFIFILLLLWSFQDKRVAQWKLIGFVISWGIAIEFLQRFMNLGRSFSEFDILANLTGTLIGFLFYKLLRVNGKL